MPTFTILNHGTMNASGDKLVLSKLKDVMVGPRGATKKKDTTATWMLNTGVGSLAQAGDRHYLPGWNAFAGTMWAKGINKNVEDSVEFVKDRCVTHGKANVTVNMVGHSRGSMTALKIAHQLQKDAATQGCLVNLFLIDPVPGNLGWVNSGMYKKIAVEANVKNAFMFLAETERRNCFKPYIDKCFLQSMPTHQLDSIPGNHGGINEVSAKHNESALIVMHHAVKFLRQYGSALGDNATAWNKNGGELLELYAKIMIDFQKYKNQGAARNNIMFLAMGNTSSGDRKVQVHNSDKKAGLMNVPFLEKNKFDSKGLKDLQATQGTGSVLALDVLSKESRFFANSDHKTIFRAKMPTAARHIERLELGYLRSAHLAMIGDAAFMSDHTKMGAHTQAHFHSWLSHMTGEG